MVDGAVGVLDDEQDVDHAHDIVLFEALQLLEHLAVEVGFVKADYEQLYGTDHRAHLSLTREKLLLLAFELLGGQDALVTQFTELAELSIMLGPAELQPGPARPPAAAGPLLAFQFGDALFLPCSCAERLALDLPAM